MKNRHQANHRDQQRGQTIMQFGQAPLLETPAGKLELKGATSEEQTEAKEFISLFMHESVVSFTE